MSDLITLGLTPTQTTSQKTTTETAKNNGGFGGGLKYLFRNFGAGIVGIGEGIYDYIVGGIATAAGNESYARHLMENNISGRIQQKAAEEFNPNGGWEFAGNVASGIGQSTVGAVVVAALGAAVAASGGTLAPAVAGIVAGSTIGLGAAGQSTAEAYSKTGELGGKEFAYGTASGVLEGGLEGLTGAAGKVGAKLVKQTAKSSAKKIARQSIAKGVFTDACGEFVEESLSEIINPYLQRGLDIDENAENATAQEVIYAGLVGFVSGALMSGTTGIATSTSNIARGENAIKKGTASDIIQQATDISKYANEAENSKLIAPAFRDLTASLNAYNAETDKTGLKAKMYLGEVQRGIALVRASTLVQESRDNIMSNPEQIAEWYAKQGQNVSAEDIATDKNGIATRIAVNDVAAKVFMPDFTSRTMGTAINKATKEYKRKGVISDETNADIVDSYRQMERLNAENSGTTLEESDYTYARDYKITGDDLKKFKDAADFMKTRGILADNYKDSIDRDRQNLAIFSAISSGKSTVAEIESIKKLAKRAGIKVRFENIKSKDGTVINGSFEKGEITINVNGADAFSKTAVHEYIHNLAENSKGQFARIKDAIVAVCDENKDLKKIYDNTISIYKSKIAGKDSAYYEEEAICKVAETFISKFGENEKNKIDLSNIDKSHIRTLRDFFARLKERIQSFGSKKSEKSITNVINVLDESLRKHNVKDKMPKTISGDNVIKLSLNESEKAEHKQALIDFAKKNGVKDIDAYLELYDRWYAQYEKICNKVNSRFVNEWNKRVGEDRVFGVIKDQQGYPFNMDLATACIKGLPMFQTIDKIVQQELKGEFDFDILGQEEKQILYDTLQECGFQTPCDICFVEQARKFEGVIIKEFLEGRPRVGKTAKKLGWNEALDKVQQYMFRDSNVEYTFDYFNNNIAGEQYFGEQVFMDETQQAAFFKAIVKLAKEYGAKKLTIDNLFDADNELSGTIGVNLKVIKVLRDSPNARLKFRKSMLYSSIVTRNIKKYYPSLFTLFNMQRGTAGYKTKQSAEIYHFDLLTKNASSEKVLLAGGFRIQSNYDFQMFMFFDYIQAVIDMDIKGYSAESYTKVLSYAKLFGLTGIKINLSLIPKVKVIYNKDGTINVEKTMENAGLDENGAPIYDNFQGINHEEAKLLASDENYSKNVSCVCIGYSDNHILKLLDVPYVQEIIGFHDKTNNANERYKTARYANNYNAGMNNNTARIAIEKGKKKLKKIPDENFRTFSSFLKEAEEKINNKSSITLKLKRYVGLWSINGTETEVYSKTFEKNDVPRLASALYLDWCAKNNYKPAYDKFKGHNNYYKLLADFTLYDSRGRYAPQLPIKFNMPQSVKCIKGNEVQTIKTDDYIAGELIRETTQLDNVAKALADTSEDGILQVFKRKSDEAKLSIGSQENSLTDQQNEESRKSFYIESLKAGDYADLLFEHLTFEDLFNDDIFDKYEYERSIHQNKNLTKSKTEMKQDIIRRIYNSGNLNKFINRLVNKNPKMKEFFKNTKIREKTLYRYNENATNDIVVMFHGTDATFNVFDGSQTEAAYYGKGFYFTSNFDYALSYGKNVKAVLLNIEKPMEMNQHDVTPSQWDTFIRKVTSNNNIDFLKLYKETGTETYDDLVQLAIEDSSRYSDYYLIDKWHEKSSKSFDSFYEIFTDITGYDGIIVPHKGWAITFKSNQSKDILNIEPTNNPDIRKSIAGSLSNTANIVERDKAIDMLNDGKSAQEVYKETGWFIGADGKMRYEIDDSGSKIKKDFVSDKDRLNIVMKYNKERVDFLNKDNERLNRNIEETLKHYDKATSSEWKSYWKNQLENQRKLIKKNNKDIVKYQNDILNIENLTKEYHSLTEDGIDKVFTAYKGKNNMLPYSAKRVKLYDILDHKELFEAYPEIKNTVVVFDDNIDSVASTELRAYGEGLQRVDRISVSKQAFYDNGKFSIEAFRKTLMHEIQHTLQVKEGFVEGSSAEEQMEYLKKLRIKEFKENPKQYKIFADTAKEFADIMVTYQDGYIRYLHVYGEQESRNVEERINLTKKERQNSMPFTGDEDSVLPEKSSKRLSISTQLENAQPLLEMPSDEKSSKFAEIKESAKDIKTSFLNTWVNAQAGIEKYCKKMGITGIEATTNFARSANSAGDYMIEKELRPIFESVKKGKKYDKEYATSFMSYLLHYHNIDRMASGIEKPVFGRDVGVLESQTAIAEIEKAHPEFKELADKVWAYNRKLLSMQLENGLITQSMFDKLTKMYPHYVPTYRDMKGAQTVAAIRGKGFVEISRSIKSAKGSDLDILPIDVMMARRTMQVIKAIRVNAVAQSLCQAGIADENGARVAVVGREKLDGNIDFDGYRPKNNQITFFEDGEAVTIAVSKDIFTGFDAYHSDINSEWDNPVMNFSTKFNNVFKKLVTAYNPFFTVRNAIRDLQDAGLYTKASWGTFAKNYARAYKEITTNGKYWKEYREAGGLNSSVFDYDKGYKRSTSGIRKALELIETVNIVVEQAPRLSEYISSREKGVSIPEALLNAGDVTVNFGRSGTFARKLNATVIPFLNPSIQGLDKIGRTVFSKKCVKEWVRLICRAFLLGIGASLLNDMLLDDDEDYKNLRQSDKENYFLIKIGENFLKIPKGRVSATISQVYYVAKQGANKEDIDWKGELDTVSSNMSPVENLSRTVFSPFTDVAKNTTWYGTAIESTRLQNYQPKDRYDENTSSISIAIGQAINYSPKKINYLLDQYSGVIGDIVLPLTSKASSKSVVEQTFVIDSATQNDVGNDFYGEIEEATYAKNTGDLKAKAKLRYLNRISEKVSDLTKEKRNIQNSDLSNVEKKSQVRALQVLINGIEKTGITDVGIFEDELSRYEITEDNYDAVYLQAYKNCFGAQSALEQYDSDVYARAQVISKLGVDYDTYFNAYFTIKATENDKDKKGNIISGSRKEKITKYIKTLDLTNIERALLLASAGYAIDDSLKKKIKNASRNLSEEEKEIIYKMCGIKG